MTSEELLDHLLSSSSREIDMDIEDLIFYLEYLGEHHNDWKRQTLLRLALHFTPKQALADHREEEHNFTDYDSEKEPYQMITEYIEENYSFTRSESQRIGQIFGQVWYEWTEERKSLSQKKREALESKLKREQNNRCNNCGVKLGNQKNSVAYEGDKFKPIHEFTSPQMDGELDHIEPVSQFGHNKSDNFQLLCRFCNQGKKDDVTISLRDRLKIATQQPEDVDPSDRRSIFFEVTSNYDACARCNTDVENIELVVRKEFNESCLTTSNLEAVCADCI
jgi:5-methylcytosine-specific restriction endonuclease McrA